MDRAEIRTVVRQLIRDKLPEPVDFTDDEIVFGSSLGLNSIHAMELLIEIERAFAITIGDDEMRLENFRSVGAISDLVDRHLPR